MTREDGDNDYVGTFSIVDGMVDGTQETDGIGVSNADFGGAFDDGLVRRRWTAAIRRMCWMSKASPSRTRTSSSCPGERHRRSARI